MIRLMTENNSKKERKIEVESEDEEIIRLNSVPGLKDDFDLSEEENFDDD